jgi:hypothetical protein
MLQIPVFFSGSNRAPFDGTIGRAWGLPYPPGMAEKVHQGSSWCLHCWMKPEKKQRKCGINYFKHAGAITKIATTSIF